MARYEKFEASGDEGSKIEVMRMEADLTGLTLTDRDGNQVTVWLNEDALDALIHRALDAKTSKPIPHSGQVTGQAQWNAYIEKARETGHAFNAFSGHCDTCQEAYVRAFGL